MDGDDASSSLLAVSPMSNLKPIKSKAFKREERQKRKERKKREKLVESLSLWNPLSTIQSRPYDNLNPTGTVSDTPWPCDPYPPENPKPTEWAPFVPSAVPKAAPLSDDSSNSNVQANALRKCKEFLEKEEDDKEDCIDEEREANDIAMLEFFSDLFENSVGLKKYYEEKKEKGDFVCLVCEKKFVGCMGLVQHATTIIKTKRTRAHRVYGITVSRVIGLEIDKALVVDSKEGNGSDSEGDLDGFVMGDMET